MPDLHRPVVQPAFPTMLDDPQAARLWLPRLSLSQCVRAIISRDTRALSAERRQGYNYYPCAPTCTLSWYVHGQGFEIMPGEERFDTGDVRPMHGRVFFSGPYTRPIVGWYPEPVVLMFVVLMPDAVKTMMQIDPGDYINQTVPVEEALSPAWQDWCAQVLAQADQDSRAHFIEDTLDERWQRHRTDSAGRISHLLADWHTGLTLRAANSGLGRSARQIERRIKQWTGQPLRELRGISKSEQAFFEAIEAMEAGEGEVSWAAVASEAGYADQSHMCRQTRRVSGFAPEELRRRITEDEGFWLYRLWGLLGVGGTRQVP